MTSSRIGCAGGRRQTFEDIFHIGPNLKSEKLIMRGPGGRGEVEVAVSAVPGIVLQSLVLSLQQVLQGAGSQRLSMLIPVLDV